MFSVYPLSTKSLSGTFATTISASVSADATAVGLASVTARVSASISGDATCTGSATVFTGASAIITTLTGNSTATATVTRSRPVSASISADATVNSITVTRTRPTSASIAGDATATATVAKIFFFDPALFTKGRSVKVTFQERRTVTVENQLNRKAFVPQDPYRNVKVAA